MRRTPLKRTYWIRKPKATRVAFDKRTGTASPVMSPKLRRALFARADGLSELSGEPLGGDWQAHHRQLRSQGGRDCLSNLVAVTRMEHTRIHANPVWAMSHGWIVSAYSDPAATPFRLRDGALVLTWPNGTYQVVTE